VIVSRLNMVLAGLLLVVALFAGMSSVDYSQPNIEVLPDMKYTPAWTAYSRNPNFPNGRTLQAPVAGTIARGSLPLYFEATKEDAIRAGNELRNPYELKNDIEAATNADDDALAVQAEEAQQRLGQSVQRGGDVYRVYCVCCHGPSGAGDGPVPKRGFPPPPSLLTGNSLQMKDGQMFHLLSYGQGSMASFAGQLSPEQRWDAINYVRNLQPDGDPAAVAVDVVEDSKSDVPTED
jgi:mono/diheme cytochrome c family protein